MEIRLAASPRLGVDKLAFNRSRLVENDGFFCWIAVNTAPRTTLQYSGERLLVLVIDPGFVKWERMNCTIRQIHGCLLWVATTLQDGPMSANLACSPGLILEISKLVVRAEGASTEMY